MPEDKIDHIDFEVLNEKAISQPLVTHIYTADPLLIFSTEKFMSTHHTI